MDKLPFRYKVAQVVADNYISILVLSFLGGFVLGFYINAVVV